MGTGSRRVMPLASGEARMGRRVLIIVENLTMPLDRRVWQEAQTLRDAGYTVSIICPKMGKYTKGYELLDGIHVFRHPLPLEADGALGYAIEYSLALFWEFVLAWRVRFKVGFDVIQACNPPDTIFILARFFRLLFGTPFIFDHHDINPELYEAKFGRRGFFHRALLWLERQTFRAADVVISTNETFKAIAIERGGKSADDVFVVRSIPDMSRFKRVEPDAALRKGRQHLVGYVGIMGAQDGVDILVKAAAELVKGRGRDDIHFAIVGSGTELEALKKLAADLGVAEHMTFTGFMTGEPLLKAFSSFDIGVIPDPKNIYNDRISMNKVFEYMTLGIPFVQFDLVEGRSAAGDAAVYAENNDPHDLADKIAGLLEASARRAALSGAGRSRAAALLRWDLERAKLLAAYRRALGVEETRPASEPELVKTAG